MTPGLLSELLDGIAEEMRKEPEAHVLAVQISLTDGADEMATVIYFRGSRVNAEDMYEVACFKCDNEKKMRGNK